MLLDCWGTRVGPSTPREPSMIHRMQARRWGVGASQERRGTQWEHAEEEEIKGSNDPLDRFLIFRVLPEKVGLKRGNVVCKTKPCRSRCGPSSSDPSLSQLWWSCEVTRHVTSAHLQTKCLVDIRVFQHEATKEITIFRIPFFHSLVVKAQGTNHFPSGYLCSW